MVLLRKPACPQSQPVIEAALVWVKKITGSSAPPAGFLRQIRPIPWVLQTTGNWMATGSQDRGADHLSLSLGVPSVDEKGGGTLSFTVLLTELCCSAAGDQKQPEPHVEALQDPYTAAVWRRCGEAYKGRHTQTRTWATFDLLSVVKNVWWRHCYWTNRFLWNLNKTLKVQCVIFQLFHLFFLCL